jgi:hypothetical protein
MDNTNTIPTFFEDSQNVIVLCIGGGIIVLCILLALLIFKLRSKSQQHSLFKSMDED